MKICIVYDDLLSLPLLSYVIPTYALIKFFTKSSNYEKKPIIFIVIYGLVEPLLMFQVPKFSDRNEECERTNVKQPEYPCSKSFRR